jgi:hypothetical protein
MAQSSFALFFLLVMAAGVATLVRTLAESWPRVLEALSERPETEAPLKVYTTTWRAAADVPHVASRLLLHELDEPWPAPKLFAPWSVDPMPERTGPQLGFAFLHAGR